MNDGRERSEVWTVSLLPGASMSESQYSTNTHDRKPYCTSPFPMGLAKAASL